MGEILLKIQKRKYTLYVCVLLITVNVVNW